MSEHTNPVPEPPREREGETVMDKIERAWRIARAKPFSVEAALAFVDAGDSLNEHYTRVLADEVRRLRAAEPPEPGGRIIDLTGIWPPQRQLAHNAPPAASLPPIPETREPTHRWNVEETDSGVRICRGGHERSQGCEWEEYVPAPPAGSGETELDRLTAYVAGFIEAIGAKPDDDGYAEAVAYATEKASAWLAAHPAGPTRAEEENVRLRAAVDEQMGRVAQLHGIIGRLRLGVLKPSEIDAYVDAENAAIRRTLTPAELEAAMEAAMEAAEDAAKAEWASRDDPARQDGEPC